MENGLVVHGFNYGDWLALDGEILKNSIHGRTDSVFLASAFYLECLRLVAETAKALGDQSEREYRDKYEKPWLRSAMNTLHRADGLQATR